MEMTKNFMLISIFAGVAKHLPLVAIIQWVSPISALVGAGESGFTANT